MILKQQHLFEKMRPVRIPPFSRPNTYIINLIAPVQKDPVISLWSLQSSTYTPYYLKYISIIFNTRIFHVFHSISKIDENDDDDDRRNGKIIYNLTDILSTSSSGFYKYERQQKLPYEQIHYKPSSSSDEKPKTKERYYIYSHVKAEVDDVAEGVNHDGDKSRKIRSSPLSDRKQVSRNISMVLENLLMSYENSQLPTHGEGLLLLLPHWWHLWLSLASWTILVVIWKRLYRRFWGLCVSDVH